MAQPSLTSTNGGWRCCCGLFTLPEHRILPVMVATADVWMGLGAGMSIRYFPIFFVDNLSLNPVVVQLMFILSPLGQAVTMHIAQVYAKRIGRCRMTVLFKWTGILFMIAMVCVYEFWEVAEPNNDMKKTWLILILYLIRTTLMNSTSALTKSMLMDHVPPSERSRWTALEAVNMFSWSGSAAFGGILVGWKGLVFNFCVTATMQWIGTFPLIALFGRDKGEGIVDEQHGGGEEERRQQLMRRDCLSVAPRRQNEDDEDERRRPLLSETNETLSDDMTREPRSRQPEIRRV
eukprot:CAMPEP_0194056560 /NCGR_PEP_ID=MMETSP0009_2-20130614/60545_1 /TAXON_ID=210454 /ORGANISM="Grammatophora oceanica, Strain CCMP 410" /LENGTH=290 /DNA_ID=CAMNT_0038705973 /DNA_START=1 /DNA_END=873 /DNA_ORIENTATION=-